MNDFFTWSSLTTFAGATSAVTLITQFVKWMAGGKIVGKSTRIVSFISALFVLYLTAYVTEKLTVDTAIITALNAVVVTLASNGLSDSVKAVTNKYLNKK